MTYGPSRPTGALPFTAHRTHSYLGKAARKIKRDLEKWFRMYQGKPVRIYTRDKSSGRCTTCTDEITGAILLDNCPECSGTGYSAGYKFVEECWAMAEIDSGMNLTSELGNSENTRAGKDAFLFTTDFLLTDKDLVIFVDTKEVYKVVDVEPRFVALNGTVVMQSTALSYLTPGAKEYAVIDW